MKLEKFVKSVGTHGVIFENKGKKWLFDGITMMLIPDTICIGRAAAMPKYMNPETFDNSNADLTKAYLPSADAKTKDIVRVFETADSDEIAISQRDFALIESGDETRILYDSYDIDESNIVGLGVYTGYGEDAQLIGIIFDNEYLHMERDED